MRRLSLAVAFIFVACSSATADEIRVIDGDTIAIGSVHYRLLGIAAPDEPKDAKDRATAVMLQLVRAGGVHCDPTGRTTYKRLEAVCFNVDGDLGAQMVSQGYALDWPKYSHGAYASQQAAAQAGKRGLWAFGYRPTTNPNYLTQ